MATALLRCVSSTSCEHPAQAVFAICGCSSSAGPAASSSCVAEVTLSQHVQQLPSALLSCHANVADDVTVAFPLQLCLPSISGSSHARVRLIHITNLHDGVLMVCMLLQHCGPLAHVKQVVGAVSCAAPFWQGCRMVQHNAVRLQTLHVDG
jgi:hypothetical protein